MADGPLPPPPRRVFICCSIWKRFCLQWKAFDLPYKMRYILWVVMLLEVCDATKHGRRLRLHLGLILSRIRDQVRTVTTNNFLRSTCKITHK